jgi:hypothetical protein
MSKSLNVRWGLWLCLIGSLLSGCSSSSSGTIGVTGKVTKGGQPVAGAAVTFVPSATEGKAASGTTDASGAYKLTTFVNGDGALPGSYKVTITKFAGSDLPAMEAGKQATPEDVDAIYKAMQEKGKYGPGSTGKNKSDEPKNEIAAKFATAETSGFAAEVKKGGSNAFDFDVTEK